MNLWYYQEIPVTLQGNCIHDRIRLQNRKRGKLSLIHPLSKMKIRNMENAM